MKMILSHKIIIVIIIYLWEKLLKYKNRVPK